MSENVHYRGRFAPSPSGPLHLGSLLAALGSYLQARSQRGQWFVRIEDIDPPREMPGAADTILRSLEAHGLFWDGAVRYQSQQSELYEQRLKQLQQAGRSYYCACTRAQIKTSRGHNNQACRALHHRPGGCAVRFVNDTPISSFTDGLQGQINIEPAVAGEDFVIHRKDGLYAYHLASVADDIDQGISEIVRGSDLLVPTACQLALFKAFACPAPDYLHLPVIATSPGMKLSKQNHAAPLDPAKAAMNLQYILALLNHPLPEALQGSEVSTILQWATDNWEISQLPVSQELLYRQ